VLGTVTSAIYFYGRATASGANWLTLSDASSAQIERIDAANGRCRVRLRSNTNGRAGDGQNGNGDIADIESLAGWPMAPTFGIARPGEFDYSPPRLRT
jgi:hypothetical protein